MRQCCDTKKHSGSRKKEFEENQQNWLTTSFVMYMTALVFQWFNLVFGASGQGKGTGGGGGGVRKRGRKKSPRPRNKDGNNKEKMRESLAPI